MAVVTQRCVGCGEQFTFTVKPGTSRRFCTKDCSNKKYQQSEEGKAYQKIYRVTDKYRLYQKQYQQSDEGKLKLKKYRQSHKGQLTKKKYQQTEKQKTARKQYRQSDLGRTTRLKIEQSRRARKRGAFVENVDVRVLLDLQNGVCFLCSQPISLDIKHPDPMSLSLDHITPLVRGGSHSYDNCAATHLHCNVVKGVKSVNDIVPLLRLVR